MIYKSCTKSSQNEHSGASDGWKATRGRGRGSRCGAKVALCRRACPVSGLLLEELSFHSYPRGSQLPRMVVIVVPENFGCRQLNSAWRLVGLWKWAMQTEPTWGSMQRQASWTNEQ